MQTANGTIQHASEAFSRLFHWLQQKAVSALAFDLGLADPAERHMPPPACVDDFPSCASPVDDEYVQAINVTRDSVVASRVSLAITSVERRRGLLGRNSMDPDEGMYIVPTQWIHMFGMRFAIDVAFLSSSGRVLFVHHALKPNRLSRLVWRAEGALELPAGTLRASRTMVGDTIELRVPSFDSTTRHVF
jgi:uncharacterized membrane protein (UPF0127 family)